ncbi:4Fe-4S binding protein [Gordonibacter sp.]|uniref:4Fe-4S binding protein n=1 Tax=Gordonibacter sp. TaxID=1968902 RepID=UPI003FA574F0
MKIDEAYCTGCLKCISVCPGNEALRAVREHGITWARVAHPERCVGCGRCVNLCPTHSISIYLV